MYPASVIALVVAIISAITSFASVWYARRSSRIDRLEQADQIALRFREPLLQAAFNLQSRLYNIVHGGLLRRLRSDLTAEADREYVIENTLHLIGQYFCWVEILRRESQFVDPRNLKRNSDLAAMLEGVRDTFAESTELTGPLRTFRGEQRAIAERMLVLAEPGSSTAPRWDAMGYASFIECRLKPEFDRWFDRLRRELTEMSEGGLPNFDRMIQVQRTLVDLIDLLDPDHHRITSFRARLADGTSEDDSTQARIGNGERDDSNGRRTARERWRATTQVE
jgi:hypothetical protein